MSMLQTCQKNKCGWLRKLGGGVVKIMHRRWFVLSNDYMFYFIKEDDSKFQGVICLHGNRIIQHPVSPDEPDKFLLELVPVKVPQHMPTNNETYLLCAASEEERQDWVKAIKKAMFAAKGGNIFGTSLEETMTYERRRSRLLKVPYIVDACIKFLIEYGLEAEGLFRESGRMLLVQDLKDKFDEGEQVELTIDEYDVYSVASLLKQYLRELPECLIPYSLHEEFMNVAKRFQRTKSVKDKLAEVESLCKALASVPKDNYYLLKYLCQFLHEVTNKTEVNKMTAHNLAIVFGPNLIRHPKMEDNPEMLTTADISEQLAYMLISYDTQIFTFEYDPGIQLAHATVDDLLRMNSMESAVGMLQPERCLATSKENNGSNTEDLSHIVFELMVDRRARTFQTNELHKKEKNDQNLPLELSLSARAEEWSLSPLNSSGPSSTNDICSIVTDEKPIPLLRRKYNRNQQIVCKKKSNNSVSSEHSENSTKNDQSDIQNHIIPNIPQVNNPNATMLDLEQKLADIKVLYNDLSTRYATLSAEKAKADEDVKNLSAELSKVQCRYNNLIAAKVKVNDDVKNLSTEMSKIQFKYDEHVRGIEASHQSKLNEIRAKLNNKCTSDDALRTIAELQNTIALWR